MSGVLLDSHVLLWLLADDDRLGPQARALISAGTPSASAASTWELAIKRGLGKVRLPDDFGQAVKAAGVVERPVTVEHTLAIDQTELPHRDPFDRLLVTVARLDGLTLLTADRVLLGLGLDRVVDART